MFSPSFLCYVAVSCYRIIISFQFSLLFVFIFRVVWLSLLLLLLLLSYCHCSNTGCTMKTRSCGITASGGRITFPLYLVLEGCSTDLTVTWASTSPFTQSGPLLETALYKCHGFIGKLPLLFNPPLKLKSVKIS